MDYKTTLEYLYESLPVFQRIGAAAYKANLDNTIALDDHLGNPHNSFATIHVAGTNGKGSVSQMIYESLRANGYRVGLYTSPHLVDFRERIIVDDEMISQQAVVDFVTDNGSFIDSIKPSFFEVTVAMAFDYFRNQRVDIAVIEVGMGGRLDSTNIISPILSVITNIDYDHTQFLGSTLPEIAAEKAGIIKELTPVIVGEMSPETALVFVEKARSLFAPLTFADQRYECRKSGGSNFTIHSLLENFEFEVKLAMQGLYQRRNVCTVLAALDVLSEKIALDPAKVRLGLGMARVRGRWEQLSPSPLTVCDTGHNKAGVGYVLEQIAEQKYEKLYLVLGMVGDKDIDGVLALLPRDAYYIFTRASIPRAMEAAELAAKAAAFDLRGEVVDTIEGAIARAQVLATTEDMIFIGGSTFVVAQALPLF